MSPATRNQLDIDGGEEGVSPKLRRPERVNLMDQYHEAVRKDAEMAAEAGVELEHYSPNAHFGREVLSTSAIGTLLACEQRWYWQRERRLDPAIKPVALEMGSAFALATEHGDPELAYQSIMSGWRAAEERYGSYPWVVVPDERVALAMAVVARGAARAYIARYGRRERREVEHRVRIRNPVTGRPSLTFDLVCRLDGLTDDNRHLVEDKLVGEIPRDGEKMQRKLALDRQVSIECYTTWRTTGVVVEDVSYRMTLKPSIRQRKGRASRDGGRTGVETFEDFLVRLEQEYAERPDHYLAEFPCTRTTEDMLRLELELWRWAEQLRSARKDGVWPRNTGACEDYGGCAYLGICSGEPGAIHQYAERSHFNGHTTTNMENR